MADRVTLKAAEEYGRRCMKIGQERRSTANLQHAMNHPEFKRRHHDLLDGLVSEYVQMLPLIERPPFATIEIGTFRKVKDLRRALIDGKCRISDYAGNLLDRITLVSEPGTLDLYGATNAELGLTQGGTVAQTFEAIAKIGGEKLPAEAGPQYRLQNPDQKLGEWEMMYMDPITGHDGYPRVFIVVPGRENGLLLDSIRARPEDFCLAVRVWMFGRK